MGTSFLASTKTAEAPDIEGGVYDGKLVRIEDKVLKGGQFQKNPDGDPKLAWVFQLLDDAGEAIYASYGEEEKIVEVDKLTGTGFNTAASNTPAEVLIMKALLTGAEYAEWEAGSAEFGRDELIGRKGQVEVVFNKNGYPVIDKVIAARKARASGRATARAAVEE